MYSPDTGKSSSRETSQTSNPSPYRKKEEKHARQTQTSLTSNLTPYRKKEDKHARQTQTSLTSNLTPYRKKEDKHARQTQTSLTSNLSPYRKKEEKHARQTQTSLTSNLTPYRKKEEKHACQTQTSLTSNLRTSGSGVFKRKCPITELFGLNAEFCNAMSPRYSNDYKLKVYTYRPCAPTISGSQYINCSTDFRGLGVPWLISWTFACYWTPYTSTLPLVLAFPFLPTSHTALCFHWSSLRWAIRERTRSSASRYWQLQIFAAD